MKENCQVVENLRCSVSSILARIIPIAYTDNLLTINSPLSVGAFLGIDGINIGGENGVLSLPEGTTVGGVPLLSPHYVDGVYVLPVKTNIDGYRVLNTHYFHFFTSTLLPSIYFFQNGGFLDNYGQNDGIYPGNYPFLVPRNCTLTSLRFSMVITAVASGGSPTSNITSTTATIYTTSTLGVSTNTGISVVISSPSPLPVNSRNYVETTFQYPVVKGTSIGIKVQFTGTVSTEVGISAFAVLGYGFS